MLVKMDSKRHDWHLGGSFREEELRMGQPNILPELELWVYDGLYPE